LDARRREFYETDQSETEPDWSRGRAGLPPAPRVGLRTLLASLTINILSLALPVVILQVYDRILPNAATSTLLLLVLGLCTVLVIDGFLRMARSYVTGWEAARFEHTIACRAVDRLLATGVGGFERDAPGVHLDRLNAIDQLRDYHAGQGKLLLVDLPFIGLFIGLMWLIAGSLILVPLALLGALALTALLVGRLLKGALRERAELDDRRYNFIIEVLNGMQTVKGLAMEALLLRRYERLQETGAASTYRCTFYSNVAQAIGSLFSNVTMAAVAAVGATYVIAGELSIGGLAACTLLSGRSVQPMLRALGIWTQFQNIKLARERLHGIFDFEPEQTAEVEAAREIRGAIALRNVTFRYNDEAPLLFENLTLEVKPGEVIGISGGTGSGKSTLLSLMVKGCKPTGGEVLIDGRPIDSYDPQRLRRQIAYVPQTAVLFQGTILDNITMFRGGGAIEEALVAAGLLGLTQSINRLPLGFDTRVGDGAQDELPAGIKQGVVMARALAAKPRIILFDEANRALDRKSDAVLKDALAMLKGGPTMILVSHRPSILALADRILDLVDGRLVARPAVPAAERPAAPVAQLHQEPAETPARAIAS